MTAGIDITVGNVEVARVPRVGNVTLLSDVGEESVNLMLRIPAC